MGILTYLKLGGAALFGVALLAGYLHYRSVAAEAAKVPALEATIATANARAEQVAQKLAAADAAREAYEKALSEWQSIKTETLDAVRKEGRRAAAAINPVCAPSPDDRGVRNAALQSLLRTGQGGSTATVPPGTNPPH